MQIRTGTKLGQEPKTKTKHKSQKKKRKEKGNTGEPAKVKLFCLEFTLNFRKRNAFITHNGIHLEQGSFTGSSGWVHFGI